MTPELGRDLMTLRRAQATPAAVQPALLALREDHRPAGERDAAERYSERWSGAGETPPAVASAH